jgi:hypothetical protein
VLKSLGIVANYVRPVRPSVSCPRCAAAVQSRMLRNMIHDVQAVAAEVIRKTGKDKPADAALREALKSVREP